MNRELDLWFATHVLPHEAGLRRWLMRLASDVDIDDVIQEAYARLAREHSRIHCARSYMFTVARSIVIETLRRRRIVRIVAMADLDASPVSDSASQEQALIVDQERALLRTVMAQLPRQCRTVLVLRKIDGLSQKEVALRLGLSESTVEKHVAAGIQRCAALFARFTAGTPARPVAVPVRRRKTQA